VPRAGSAAAPTPALSATNTIRCLPSGDGFFKARLAGALEMQLDWSNAGTHCEGMPRPNGDGIRMSFSRALDLHSQDSGDRRLLILLGIGAVSESRSGHALPANLTIIEEGSGRIFGTRGDDKCTVDEINQQLLKPWQPKARVYRVTGRGFCLQPARAIGSDASVLVSIFDFAGQVVYEESTVGKPQGPL
jgi:hypothetical protein